MIHEEGSALLAIVFNNLPDETKELLPESERERICEFMYKNGYRFVFTRWYLQAKPNEQLERKG